MMTKKLRISYPVKSVFSARPVPRLPSAIGLPLLVIHFIKAYGKANGSLVE